MKKLKKLETRKQGFGCILGLTRGLQEKEE
jgi:hypothetical protein